MTGGREVEGLRLSPSARAELERIVRDGPRNLARRARIILARDHGASLGAIAASVGMHRDSIRRWLVRYRLRGIEGLQHGNAGKPKNVVFHAPIRAEIQRRASISPRTLGESYPNWSLYKLRDHLVGHGVVRTISIERLRQLLRSDKYSREFWEPPSRRVGPLSPRLKEELLKLTREARSDQAQRARVVLAVAEGASIAEVASRLHLGRNSIRRCIDCFQHDGVAGLIEQRPSPRSTDLVSPGTRQAIVALARSHPRSAGEPSERWSLRQLQSLLIRRGIVSAISTGELRRIFQSANITLAEGRGDTGTSPKSESHASSVRPKVQRSA
jgi:transposase